MTFDEGIPDAFWLNRLREAESEMAAGRIGSYELVSEVGRGGQGVVFRARQPGTHRQIALKRLVGGRLATREARARFDREVEAVCALNHPNIVTVYGVESIDGQPVLAMEWIDGEPLDDWARGAGGERRPLGELLNVFLKVCEAVQHAHLRGVIHRDLKPSNILVSADGTPRVLDFGLARVTEPDSWSAARLTYTAEFLGTPAYASPEQVELGPVAVDARTDVYSLGALLYELLCGRTPHDTSLGLPALLESIRSREPATPSAVARGIDRDLDVITLKALAKDARRRYQSVDALRADVRRYLAGEPVTAHPPSLAYQLQKMIRRHRTSFVLVLAVFALAVGFGITATTFAIRLNRERLAAVAAREDEADARAAAEEVTGFLRQMMSAARPQEAQGREITVSQIVDQAMQRAEGSFATRPAVEAAIRLTLGETLHGLGRHADAQKELERARLLLRELYGGKHRETAWATLNLGHAHRAQGHFDEAIKLYGAALDAYRDLPAERPRLAATLDSLASLHMERNDLAAAERHLLEVRALRGELPDVKPADDVRDTLLLASLQFHRGDHAAAEQLLLGALGPARSALGDRDELTLAVLGNLAVALKQQGKIAEARGYSQECLATFRSVYGDDHARTLNAAGNLASLLQALKEYAESEALYRDTLGRFREQGRLDDPVAIAGAINLASLFLEQARYDEAELLLLDAVERARRIFGPQHPTTGAAMASLARAIAAGGSGTRAADAQRMLKDALAILEAALPPGHPHIQKVRDQLAEVGAEGRDPP